MLGGNGSVYQLLSRSLVHDGQTANVEVFLDIPRYSAASDSVRNVGIVWGAIGLLLDSDYETQALYVLP